MTLSPEEQIAEIARWQKEMLALKALELAQQKQRDIDAFRSELARDGLPTLDALDKHAATIAAENSLEVPAPVAKADIQPE